MEDREIVSLFWNREEEGLLQAQEKYEKYCYQVAFRILSSHEDARECINDAFLSAWRAIPPHKPENLKTFLGKITRNLSLNRYEYRRAQKRESDMELILHEVEEFLPAGTDTAEEVVWKDLIDRFLFSLPKNKRILFVRRYWYCHSLSKIAKEMEMTESAVKTSLFRTREKFKNYLEKEGVSL